MANSGLCSSAHCTAALAVSADCGRGAGNSVGGSVHPGNANKTRQAKPPSATKPPAANDDFLRRDIMTLHPDGVIQGGCASE